jgi:hypothetical protein
VRGAFTDATDRHRQWREGLRLLRVPVLKPNAGDEGLLGRLHYGKIDYFHEIGPWYG